MNLPAFLKRRPRESLEGFDRRAFLFGAAVTSAGLLVPRAVISVPRPAPAPMGLLAWLPATGAPRFLGTERDLNAMFKRHYVNPTLFVPAHTFASLCAEMDQEPGRGLKNWMPEKTENADRDISQAIADAARKIADQQYQPTAIAWYPEGRTRH